MWPAGAEITGPLPGQDWPWTAVGRVLIDGDGPCSGVLVAPRTVLTVGHCVAESGWQATPADRLSFALETRAHAVAAVRLSPRSPVTPEGKIEDVRQDWALLELAEPPPVAPVPYGGPAAARRAFALGEPLVKTGWVPRAGLLRRVRDYVCRIQELAPEATALVYRCPGGAGAGRSGSALIQRAGQGFEVVAVQSAVAIRESVEFGIAVAPPIQVAHGPVWRPSKPDPPPRRPAARTTARLRL
jgi:protease YdgD